MIDFVIIKSDTFIHRHVTNPFGGIGNHVDIAGLIRNGPPETGGVERVGMAKVLFHASAPIFRVLGVLDGSLLGVVPVKDTINGTTIVIRIVTRIVV